jgi:hypothetical protein
MIESTPAQTPARLIASLSQLLLPLRGTEPLPLAEFVRDPQMGLATLTREEFDEFVALADSNHVIIRALTILVEVFRFMGDAVRTDWAMVAIQTEQQRIDDALPFLHAICSAFHARGLDITVMKSLDHWPDLGSDLDLFTNATPDVTIGLMQKEFQAQLAERSWGDRLAQKWNFILPGLSESVEIHIGRLGQTGEQLELAANMPRRARTFTVDTFTFPIPHASDRLMVSTLQRMYRHFYFRLCDIIDSTELVSSGVVDFEDLRRSARAAGIWEGVATYLVIVSDYTMRYGAAGLQLPEFVTAAARFDGSFVYFAKQFIRVPILPQSVRLYRRQLAGLLLKGKVAESARLSLLPGLATAALIEQKRTGSDKGIW